MAASQPLDPDCFSKEVVPESHPCIFLPPLLPRLQEGTGLTFIYIVPETFATNSEKPNPPFNEGKCIGR